MFPASDKIVRILSLFRPRRSRFASSVPAKFCHLSPVDGDCAWLEIGNVPVGLAQAVAPPSRHTLYTGPGDGETGRMSVTRTTGLGRVACKHQTIDTYWVQKQKDNVDKGHWQIIRRSLIGAERP